MERDGSGLVQSLRRDPRQGRHRPTSSPTDLVGKLFMRHDTSNWTDGILTATAPPPAGCRFAAQSSVHTHNAANASATSLTLEARLVLLHDPSPPLPLIDAATVTASVGRADKTSLPLQVIPVTVRPTSSREGPFTVRVAADSPYTLNAAAGT
ncbi:uncharacterized protein CLUP02_11466 [Colletotrichum lupini]|uniref:Uncharacterized protein n=1 Tax=Colletotrichum lupini TaxID=145971 RepID=A0A9Q8T0G7_9PEZI|nr:uncharacterized protein CLUP02_11466 [Colletotrichum lupini]UQC85967.1 hypothetical protein CLUP02_11466 [Colletotrichum lupini]